MGEHLGLASEVEDMDVEVGLRKFQEASLLGGKTLDGGKAGMDNLGVVNALDEVIGPPVKPILNGHKKVGGTHRSQRLMENFRFEGVSLGMVEV
ncbi:hypothetical protein Q3G72_001934 [Acer saccharum]|nr:hypothetical protein Q3G72_001934 [Acer saccharum]